MAEARCIGYLRAVEEMIVKREISPVEFDLATSSTDWTGSSRRCIR